MDIGNEINENEVFRARFVELYNKDPKSLQALEEEFGAARQTISRWMNGTSLPNATSLVKIAMHYNVSVDYLLGLTDTAHPDVNARVAVAYTGLSEEAVEWLHIGLDGFECDGVGVSEDEKQKNLRTASALIASRAFTKIIHHLSLVAEEAYCEKACEIMDVEHSECGSGEEDPEFHYANDADRDFVKAALTEINESRRPWVVETIHEKNDDELAGVVMMGLLDAREGNELHQFHVSKALAGYLDQVVEAAYKRATQRFKTT